MFGERNSMQSQTVYFIYVLFSEFDFVVGVSSALPFENTQNVIQNIVLFTCLLTNSQECDVLLIFPKSRNKIARLYLPSHPIPPSGILPGHKRRQPWKMSTHQILMSPLGVLHKYSKDLWLCGRPKDYPSFAMFTWWELYWYDWNNQTSLLGWRKKSRENISKIALVAKFDSVKV